MVRKLDTERKPTEAFATTRSSGTIKPSTRLLASELFKLGEVRRPLPSFVDPSTTWDRVPEDVKEWIRSALRDRPVRFPWYWFGPVGSGKSSAAALVYQCAPEEVELDNGERVSCTPFAFRLDDLVQTIKKARKGGAEIVEGQRSFLRSEATIFKMMRRASVVIIDEVAQRKEKNYSFERDRAIVDKIADQLQFCRTILTSNVAPKKRGADDTSATLQDIYDARIASRLLANGVAREFAGARMRNSKLRVEFNDKGGK